jgi:hypothetical protein
LASTITAVGTAWGRLILADVLALIDEEVNVVGEPKTARRKKVRVVSHLVSICLKAIEAGELAARVDCVPFELAPSEWLWQDC